MALTFWLVGLVMLARPAVNRWLANAKPWMAVIAGNRICMTVFLWQLTAMLVASLILLHLGLHPSPLNPAFLPLALATLAMLVTVFGRFERAPVAGAKEGRAHMPAA
ncbi:MAG TPA: hypothetical protein VFW71_06055 [Actinomycetota bacterium]|nr:hypothetical protein [Actinomycetota bacterium]